MMGFGRRFLFHVLLLLGIVWPFLDKAAAQVSPTAASLQPTSQERVVRTPPPGFEDLVTVQTRAVPIILDGNRVGMADARIDLDTLTFADPAAVVALIANVNDRDAVLAALTGPLPLRADQACGDTPRFGCGRLAPDVAGVIYDRVSEEALVFVNPTLRRYTSDLSRLRPTGVEPALVGGARLFFSGDTQSSTPRYTLNLDTALGLDHRHISLRGAVARERSDLDELAFRSVRDGEDLRIGLFEGAASQFRLNERIIGVRMGATLDDLSSTATAYDSPVVVAITAPARIEAFLGDRLIGSARYPAGSVRIDTSGFPAGAYTVRLRIDEGGSIREEERFFSRDTAFPPVGAPQSYVAFGARRTASGFSPSAQRDLGWEAQLGHRRSLDAGFGLGGAAFFREGSVGLEGTVAHAFPGVTLSGGVFWSSAREHAVSAAVRTEFSDWRIWGDLRYIDAPKVAFADRGKNRHLAATEPFVQSSVSLSRNFGAASFSLFGFWRDSPRAPESWSLQPTFDMPVPLGDGRIGIRLTGNFTETNEQLRFELTFQNAPWRGASATTRASWRDQRRGRSGPSYEANLQQTQQIEGVGDGAFGLRWRQEPESREVNANARLTTQVGAAAGDFTQNLTQNRGTYFGSADFGFAITRSGVALGPSNRARAAIVFVNESSARDATATALVGGARVAALSPGQRYAHSVEPFRSVTAAMIPATGAAIATTARPQSAQLFPGTVAIIDAAFENVVASFGQLVDARGIPIADAWLDSGVAQGQTDANGWFQLDVGGKRTISVRRRDGQTCSFTPANAPVDSAPVWGLGQVRCN